MKHTLTTAARATGVSRSTIHRAVQSGKVSATKNEEGEYRIDPAELHRVYPAIPVHPKEADLKQSEMRSDTGDGMAEKLLDLVTEQKDELAEARAKQTELANELRDTQEKLQAHREAATLLVDPKTFEAKQAELQQKLQQQQTDQKRKESEWQKAIADRQLEIKQARAEANEIRQREADQAKALKAERDRVAALESRGFFARVLNKKLTTAG